MTTEEPAASQEFIPWQLLPGKKRRTIENSVRAYLSSQQIYDRLMDLAKGWQYRIDKEHFRARDLALISLIYLIAVRESEVIRIRRNQFVLNIPAKMWIIQGIELSKTRSAANPKWRQRHDKWREGWLPLHAQDPYRKKLTQLVTDYVKDIPLGERIFPMKGRRVQQIVTAQTGAWPHYFRMAGLNYLYEAWNKDVIAVSKYVKIDLKTLMHYLGQRTHEAV